MKQRFVNLTCFDAPELWKDTEFDSDEILLLDVIDDIDFCDDIDMAEEDIWLDDAIWCDDDICLEEEEEEDWKDDDCIDEDCIEDDCIEEDFMEDTWLNPLDSSLKDPIFDSCWACEKFSDPPRCY